MNHLAPAIDIHDQLNPLLWRDDQLDPEIKQALLKIARSFWKFVSVPVTVLDVTVTGSQTGYTYTDQSDLDLHIIVRYQDVACDQPVEELFKTKRDLWRERHTITVKGIPVECYVEDQAEPVKGGSYSLLRNQWIQRPTRVPDLEETDLEKTAQAWITVIAAAVHSRDSDQLKQIKQLLKLYRQQGLERQGELGRANLVFKSLRNTGVLELLLKAERVLHDRQLSLKD